MAFEVVFRGWLTDAAAEIEQIGNAGSSENCIWERDRVFNVRHPQHTHYEPCVCQVLVAKKANIYDAWQRRGGISGHYNKRY